MSFNRRQFLILSGIVSGFGLSVVLQRIFTKAKLQNSSTLAPTIGDLPKTYPAAGETSLPPQDLFAPPRGDVRIVAISDFNSAYGSTTYEREVDKAIALIPNWKPDLVIGGGDMVAGQKLSLTAETIRTMWAAFDEHIGSKLRQAGLPFGFTIGNHDGSGVLGEDGKILFQQDRDLAATYWNNPQHDSLLQFVDRANFPFYYTFEQNGIFFLVWDASTAKIPDKQLAWVRKSLSSSKAKSAKMRIVIGHLPLYAVAVGRNKAGEILENANTLRSLLEHYRVHTYISGHHHAYFPGHRGQLHFLHAGAIGSGPRQLLNSKLPPEKTLTVVDINLASESTTYTTYNMKTLQLIDHRQLPRIIVGYNGMELREDVMWDELTASERSLCFKQLKNKLCGS